MTRVLMVFGSAYGQTEKIVRRMANRLEADGVECTIVRGDALPATLEVGAYDGYIVAGSILFGRHQKYLESFAHQYHDLLGSRPSMFLSVCGVMNSGTPEGEAEAQKYRLEFLRQTHWTPSFSHSLAGGIPYTRYNFFIRQMMRMISRLNHGPVDTSRDWEFTDWEAVDRYAGDFAQALAGHAPPVAV